MPALEKITGWDPTPRLRNKVPFSSLLKKHHFEALKAECLHREMIPSEDALNYTAWVKMLKAHERDRLRAEEPGQTEAYYDEEAKAFEILSPGVEFGIQE